MFGKFKAWLNGRFGKRAYPRILRTGMEKPKDDRVLTIPIAKGFELEGLGVLGEGKARSSVLDKEAFRD